MLSQITKQISENISQSLAKHAPQNLAKHAQNLGQNLTPSQAQNLAKIKEFAKILQVRILGLCGYASALFASGRNVALIGTLALIFASPKS